MRTGLRRRAALATLLLLLLSATLWSTGPAPASAATGGCGADMGSRQVVVLVHGFNSDVTTWTKYKPAMLAAISGADPGNVYVRLFDYGSKSTQWVTDPAIGPALASFARCLAQASTKAGGSGKVILVGHSMGGLAIRCALDAVCTPDPLEPDKVGLVVTIGTPNAGSQLRPSQAADATARLAGETLNLLCDIAQITNGYEWLTKACQTVRALGASPAGQAFTIGSHEIDELAPYPLHIPVRAIAGAVTLQADIGLWKYPVPMGDLVVGVKSQLLLHTDDRLGGTRTVNCGAANILVGPHCWHQTETAFAGIQSEVRQAVKDYLAAHSPAPVAPPPDPNGYVAPDTDPGQDPVPAGYHLLGGVDLDRYCKAGWGLHAMSRYPNAYGWACSPSTVPAHGARVSDQAIRVMDACSQQYAPTAISHFATYTDRYSWQCWAP